MVESTAIDPIMVDIVRDERLSPTAVRLYVLLRNGADLETAAQEIGRNAQWLKRHERLLRDLGYIEIHDVRSARGRQRHYSFPVPDRQHRLERTA